MCSSNHNITDFTAQAVQNEGKFILALLSELELNRVNKSGKAQIVKILKSMSQCLEHGEAVNIFNYFLKNKTRIFKWRDFFSEIKNWVILTK